MFQSLIHESVITKTITWSQVADRKSFFQQQEKKATR